MNIAPITAPSYNTPGFKGVNNVAKPSMISKSAAGIHNIKVGAGKAWDKFIDDTVIKHVVLPIMNSDKMMKLADKTKNCNNMAAHMSTAGSFVTTAFYVNQTLKKLNKDEEQKKRAKTLALNQVLVTGVSTVLGYTVNGALGKFSKKLGHKFRELNQDSPKLATRMKGFDIAKQLLIFSLMYRYVAPVFVTPVASKISKVADARKAAKEQKEQNVIASAHQPVKVVSNAPKKA